MYRIRRNRNHWKRRWPWRKAFKPKVDDRYCKECGLPYQEGPMPEPNAAFRSSSVEILKFPAGSFRSKESVFRVVRLRATGRQLRYSDYIPEAELKDVVSALQQIRAQKRGSRKAKGNRKVRLA